MTFGHRANTPNIGISSFYPRNFKFSIPRGSFEVVHSQRKGICPHRLRINNTVNYDARYHGNVVVSSTFTVRSGTATKSVSLTLVNKDFGTWPSVCTVLWYSTQVVKAHSRRQTVDFSTWPFVCTVGLYACLVCVSGQWVCMHVWSVCLDSGSVCMSGLCVWTVGLYACLVCVSGQRVCMHVWSVCLYNGSVCMSGLCVCTMGLYACLVCVSVQWVCMQQRIFAFSPPPHLPLPLFPLFIAVLITDGANLLPQSTYL